MDKKDSYKKSINRYKKRNVLVNDYGTKNFIDLNYKSAKPSFSKLEKPRICSQKDYISICINQEILKDMTKRSVTPINTNQIPDDLKGTIKFFQNSLYHQLTSKTKKSVLAMAKQDFIKVIKERNLFAQN